VTSERWRRKQGTPRIYSRWQGRQNGRRRTWFRPGRNPCVPNGQEAEAVPAPPCHSLREAETDPWIDKLFLTMTTACPRFQAGSGWALLVFRSAPLCTTPAAETARHGVSDLWAPGPTQCTAGYLIGLTIFSFFLNF
jgi:hypothetical protein